MEELFERAQSGSRDAFVEWCWQCQAKIGQFGFQNGVSPNRSGKYQLAVFQEFYQVLPGLKPNEADNRLWQTAISKLAAFNEKTKDAEIDVLRFEEDLETHAAIQALAEPQRVALALVSFIKKSSEEAAWITEKTEQQINDQLAAAKAELTRALGMEKEDQTEKRLEFVAKSYARISLPFPEEELFSFEEQREELLALGKSPATNKAGKRTAVLLAAAGLFISGVIGASFLLNDPNPNIASSTEAASAETITKEMVKNWQAEYDAIRQSSPERLGIDSKTYEKFAYVKEADAAKKRVLGKEAIKKMENDPKKMEHEVNKLLLKIETPKGMELKFPDAFLAGEEVEAFLDNYKLKTTELIEADAEIFERHASALSQIRFNGEMSAEKLLANNDEFPEEIERLLGGLREQSLTVLKHPSEDRFIMRRNMETFYANDVLNSYLLSTNHFNLMMNEPYFDEQGLLVPIEGLSHSLMMMEEALLLEERSSEIYEDYLPIFMQSFWLALKGNENQPVFDQKGVVKPEYRRTWKELAMQTKNPMIFILLPILDEMEASGWTASKSYDQLAYKDLLRALELEKEGALAERLPYGNFEVESARIEMDHFDAAPIAQLYDSFSKNYDLKLLEGVPPLQIVLLFDYANGLEDAETMWHLLAEEEEKPELEEYKAIWRKMPALKEEAGFLEIAEDSPYRIGANVYVEPMIGFKDEQRMWRQAQTLVASDNDTWLVRTQLYEGYDLAVKEAPFVKKVESLYETFSAWHNEALLNRVSPAEIGGMYLLAREKGDTQSMMALSEGAEQEQALVAFETSQLETVYPYFKELSSLNFSIDYSYYGYTENHIRGGLNVERITADSSEGYTINMVKTEKGWRMEDLIPY
ncbi:hypothetical protein QWY22_06485 [Planococcus liqunii]|uniref:hypothetical protein n=1 Tax=Planococcus liqunii TaxID=3058394 RepID=UPI002633CEFC|nr:hypothetical protein [Planococcus sp. N056]WKA52222.1 hypothetical protein QWY22_06485 [Planococcus sp. N056]